MTVKTKVEPIADFIEIAVNSMLSPTAQKQAIATFARERLADAQQTNRSVLGRVPPHTTAVDGRKDAALESVNPQRGVIVFEFELMTDVLLWIAKTLQERSPFTSGDYQRGHTLFADGQEVAIGDTIPPAQEYSFTNPVPYSRKIEIGKTKEGRAFVIQVAPNIYLRTAKDARARFGNLAKIEFTFRGIVGGAQINPMRAGATGLQRGKSGRFVARGGVRAHNKSDVRFPTIVIRQPER